MSEAEISVFDILDGTAYPTDKVTVYLDRAAGYEALQAKRDLQALDERIAVIYAGGQDVPDELLKEQEALVAKYKAATAKVEENALVFHLQGQTPEAAEQIIKHYNTTEEVEVDGVKTEKFVNVPDELDVDVAAAFALLGRSIAAVTKTDGTPVTKPEVWGMDEVFSLIKRLNEDQQERLIGKATELNFQSHLFDESVDAGFLGGLTIEAN